MCILQESRHRARSHRRSPRMTALDLYDLKQLPIPQLNVLAIDLAVSIGVNFSNHVFLYLAPLNIDVPAVGCHLRHDEYEAYRARRGLARLL
ncbi:unnamed protein product [Peronospora belbahrii]|uniref:Uncharacterized protein n=1 Tax=Peronospora belbahrii TaxID=622444 RepID=A0AAU9L5G1_9STRA|nr:unnamed protein product [Peronospora belbahrii]CAH0518255.1 unnamed protein product [Peronospora belbahrii]